MFYDLKIIYEPSKINNYYVVYILTDVKNSEIMHVGMSQLGKLFSLPDAKANPAYMRYIYPGKEILLQVCDITASKIDAQRALSVRLRQLPKRPAMMIAGIGAARNPIYCNETGEIFNTVAEVCNAHGVTQSALSQHLRQSPGFRTVKGKTYFRVTAGNNPRRTNPNIA